MKINSLFSHILLLFLSPKRLVKQITKYEKLVTYLLYCTRYCAITSSYATAWQMLLVIGNCNWQLGNRTTFSLPPWSAILRAHYEKHCTFVSSWKKRHTYVLAISALSLAPKNVFFLVVKK